MKCQNCANKVAMLHITEILSDQNYEEMHLCDDCAQKYLYTAANGKKEIASSDEIKPAEKSCGHCGIKFVDFRNGGRLGCPHDYEVFQSELLPLLESIHGSSRHSGKCPARRSRLKDRRGELLRLKKQLDDCIAEEAYEKAAQLRDQIRQLEAS